MFKNKKKEQIRRQLEEKRQLDAQGNLSKASNGSATSLPSLSNPIVLPGPSTDDFRMSLIFPQLDKRFDNLREGGSETLLSTSSPIGASISTPLTPTTPTTPNGPTPSISPSLSSPLSNIDLSRRSPLSSVLSPGSVPDGDINLRSNGFGELNGIQVKMVNSSNRREYRTNQIISLKPEKRDHGNSTTNSAPQASKSSPTLVLGRRDVRQVRPEITHFDAPTAQLARKPVHYHAEFQTTPTTPQFGRVYKPNEPDSNLSDDHFVEPPSPLASPLFPPSPSFPSTPTTPSTPLTPLSPGNQQYSDMMKWRAIRKEQAFSNGLFSGKQRTDYKIQMKVLGVHVGSDDDLGRDSKNLRSPTYPHSDVKETPPPPPPPVRKPFVVMLPSTAPLPSRDNVHLTKSRPSPASLRKYSEKNMKPQHLKSIDPAAKWVGRTHKVVNEKEFREANKNYFFQDFTKSGPSSPTQDSHPRQPVTPNASVDIDAPGITPGEILASLSRSQSQKPRKEMTRNGSVVQLRSRSGSGSGSRAEITTALQEQGLSRKFSSKNLRRMNSNIGSEHKKPVVSSSPLIAVSSEQKTTNEVEKAKKSPSQSDSESIEQIDEQASPKNDISAETDRLSATASINNDSANSFTDDEHSDTTENRSVHMNSPLSMPQTPSAQSTNEVSPLQETFQYPRMAPQIPIRAGSAPSSSSTTTLPLPTPASDIFPMSSLSQGDTTTTGLNARPSQKKGSKHINARDISKPKMVGGSTSSMSQGRDFIELSRTGSRGGNNEEDNRRELIARQLKKLASSMRARTHAHGPDSEPSSPKFFGAKLRGDQTPPKDGGGGLKGSLSKLMKSRKEDDAPENEDNGLGYRYNPTEPSKSKDKEPRKDGSSSPFGSLRSKTTPLIGPVPTKSKSTAVRDSPSISKPPSPNPSTAPKMVRRTVSMKDLKKGDRPSSGTEDTEQSLRELTRLNAEAERARLLNAPTRPAPPPPVSSTPVSPASEPEDPNSPPRIYPRNPLRNSASIKSRHSASSEGRLSSSGSSSPNLKGLTRTFSSGSAVSKFKPASSERDHVPISAPILQQSSTQFGTMDLPHVKQITDVPPTMPTNVKIVPPTRSKHRPEPLHGLRLGAPSVVRKHIIYTSSAPQSHSNNSSPSSSVRESKPHHHNGLRTTSPQRYDNEDASSASLQPRPNDRKRWYVANATSVDLNPSPHSSAAYTESVYDYNAKDNDNKLEEANLERDSISGNSEFLRQRNQARTQLEGLEVREMSDGSVMLGVVKTDGKRRSFISPSWNGNEQESWVEEEIVEKDEEEQKVFEMLQGAEKSNRSGRNPESVLDWAKGAPATLAPPTIPSRSPQRTLSNAAANKLKRVSTIASHNGTTTKIYYAPEVNLTGLLDQMVRQQGETHEVYDNWGEECDDGFSPHSTIEEQLDEVMKSLGVDEFED